MGSLTLTLNQNQLLDDMNSKHDIFYCACENMSKYLYLAPNKFGNYFPDLFGGVDYGRRSEELVQSLPFEGRQIMVYNINIQSHISKGNESRLKTSRKTHILTKCLFVLCQNEDWVSCNFFLCSFPYSKETLEKWSYEKKAWKSFSSIIYLKVLKAVF